MSKMIYSVTEFNEALGAESRPLQHRCAVCNQTVGPAFEANIEYDEVYEYFIPCVHRNDKFYCEGH